MQHISKLKFVKLSVKLCITYVLDWLILTITYKKLALNVDKEPEG